MKRVLLVEDNEDNSDLICAFLEGLYEIHTTRTGMEALDWLKEGSNSRLDLLLFDIALPGMDGVELLKKVRTISALQDVPAVALTAHAMKGDDQEFLDAGFNAYVSKPILDEGRLLRTLRELVDGSAESTA